MVVVSMMAVWFDCPDNRCIDTVGAKAVTIVTTGHEKMRITVCLTASSDGRKLLPYVLINRKCPVPNNVMQFEKKLSVNWNGSVWMNDETTEASDQGWRCVLWKKALGLGCICIAQELVDNGGPERNRRGSDI